MRPDKETLIVEEAVDFYASDGVRLEARLWHRGGRRGPLLVVLPGFAQHKDTPVFTRVCALLSREQDLLCLDLRGTGASAGRYAFGAQEQRDAEAALRWGAKRYREVELMGFSLGAYIALRAASENPGLAKRVFLVSCPTRVEDIALTLGPLRHPFAMLLAPGWLKARLAAGGNPFFRWDWPFRAKPRGEALAAALKTPAAFLTGLRDRLVLPGLSRRVHAAAEGAKDWVEWTDGMHAEFMAVTRGEDFVAWMRGARWRLIGAGKGRRATDR